MSVLQAFLIGIIYYLSDAPWYFGHGYYTLQKPVVAGFLTGLVMGQPVQGAIIGATINLIYLGHMNVGGSMPSDTAIAGYIGTALALATGVDTETALAIAVPLGLFGTIFWVGKMTIDSFFVHWADNYAAKGNSKGVVLMNWLPCQVMMLVAKVIIALCVCLIGQNVLIGFLSAIEGTPILHALGVVGGLLPALGIGLNLRAILKKDTIAFLLIGFLLVAFFQLSVVGVALFGVAFAAIYVFYASGKEESYE